MNDLFIALDNDIVIQILIQNSYPHYGEDAEQYRFFEIGIEGETEEQAEQRKHYVVYGKTIEIE